MEFPPKLVQTIRAAKDVAVLTGAGVSAESGVPTFREAQTGLWVRYDPQELATPEAFSRNPGIVWEWYTWRRKLIARSKPNPGHYALVDMEQRFSRFSLITQNVDSLHQLAGSKTVINLHGNIQLTKCSQEGIQVEKWVDTGEIPPRCPNCGGLLRPDVVWFGEALPPGAFKEASQVSQNCDLFLSIGTSGVVEPAASLPYLALEHGAVVVEINPSETPLTSSATYAFQGASGQVLPALVEAVWS
jgi:NAD-dependent deacetylase